MDKVQLINTVINRVFHNCVGRIKLYVMDRVNMYFLGARCLPHMGKLLSQHGQAAFPGWAELLSNGCPIQAFISMFMFTEFRQR